MPIYEYRCENGHEFEAMQSITADPLTECEVCGAPAQRVLHPPAVHFKGSGFYTTDYGSKRRSRELRDAAEGKGKYEKGDSSSSDSSSGSSSDGASGKDSKPSGESKKPASKTD
jgi:putative FmdB family regulatory protein